MVAPVPGEPVDPGGNGRLRTAAGTPAHAQLRSAGAIGDGLKESPSPSATYSQPSYTSSPDVNAQGTGLTGGSDTSTPEPTEEATPDGCARGNQVFRSNLDMYDKRAPSVCA